MQINEPIVSNSHCVKSVQIRSFFWSVFSRIQSEYEKYGIEKTPYLDTSHTVSPPSCDKTAALFLM